MGLYGAQPARRVALQPASPGMPASRGAAAAPDRGAWAPSQARLILLAARPKGRGKAAWLPACKGLEAYAQGELPLGAAPRACCSRLRETALHAQRADLAHRLAPLSLLAWHSLPGQIVPP